MRAAGIAKELGKVVVGHSVSEDVHDGYGDIKNDFSVVDRKRAIDTLNFAHLINYDDLTKLRPKKTELRDAINRAHMRNKLKTQQGKLERLQQ